MKPHRVTGAIGLVLLGLTSMPMTGCIDPQCGRVEAIGDPLWGTSPGLCAGECASQQLNVDGSTAQLVISGDDTCERSGSLTPELRESIDALELELSEGASVGEPDPSCASIPDVGQAWIELSETLSWGYTRGCPPVALVELDERLEAVALGLYECRANEWVEPEAGCRPVE